jgi:hypothetical protein
VRRVAFVKPGYFVIFDDLKARGNPAAFDFLLHLPNRERVEIESSAAIYNGEKASLGVRFFAPKDAKLSLENGRIPYHIFSARTPAETPLLPAYLDFKTAKPVSEMQFLTAIVPAKNEGAARGLINQMTEISGENLKGIRVERGSETDLVMFRTGAETQTIRQGAWSAEAAALTMTNSANDLRMFAVQNARFLRRGGQVLYSSELPANIAVNFNVNEIEAVYNANAATKASLFVGKNPVRVLLDGKNLSAEAFSFNRADNTISLNILAGQHDLKIMFQ